MLSGVYYGEDCELGVVRSAVSTIDLHDEEWQTMGIGGAHLVVDGAMTGTYVALASAAEGSGFLSGGGFTMVAPFMSSVFTCQGASRRSDDFDDDLPGAAIAVEVLRDGATITQLRDPPILRIDAPEGTAEIALSGGRATHFGHSIFHEAAGSGATCASCHPEGGDDGHVWQFDVGPRRTQTLTGGILSTAPFHWAGDVADVTAVMDGTFVGRMGGLPPRDYEVESLALWMDALPALRGPSHDALAVERGRSVFGAAGCADCHTGASGTNSTTVDVGTGGRFQVPALTEVAFHAPYFHDGSQTTLGDVLNVHFGGSALTIGERADLEAYLLSM
jgi:cytochrome c553